MIPEQRNRLEDAARETGETGCTFFVDRHDVLAALAEIDRLTRELEFARIVLGDDNARRAAVERALAADEARRRPVL